MIFIILKHHFRALVWTVVAVALRQETKPRFFLWHSSKRFLCLQLFFLRILLDSQNIFSLKWFSEKFSFENNKICIQNQASTRLKSRSNECIFWNTFEHAQLEVILAKTKNLFFTVFQLDSRNFFSQNLIFSRRRFDWMRLWIRILFLT